MKFSVERADSITRSELFIKASLCFLGGNQELTEGYLVYKIAERCHILGATCIHCPCTTFVVLELVFVHRENVVSDKGA